MLCVKTYLLTKSNEVSEIRRFSANSEFTFASLVAKIREVYNIEQNKPLRLQWLDTDGDRVAFSTDPELLDAVGSAEATGDRTLRLFVSALNAMSDVLHPNVLCDGCECPVRGYRLKCVICPDFDLCCACMAMDMHSEHPMLLLRRPRDPFFCKLNRWSRSSWSRRPPAGEQQQHQQQQQQQQSDVCQQVMREISEAAQRCAGLYSSQQQSAAMSAQASSCSSGGFSLADCHAGGGSMTEVMHSVSSSLSSILHPLGIDVSYHADEQQPRQKPPQPQHHRHHRRDDDEPRRHSPSATPELIKTEEPKDAPDDEDEEEEAIVVDLAMSDTCEQAAPELPERVVTALGQMKAMGFSDDGELTRLLVINDGNIGRVLDAIRNK